MSWSSCPQLEKLSYPTSKYDRFVHLEILFTFVYYLTHSQWNFEISVKTSSFLDTVFKFHSFFPIQKPIYKHAKIKHVESYMTTLYVHVNSHYLFYFNEYYRFYTYVNSFGTGTITGTSAFFPFRSEYLYFSRLPSPIFTLKNPSKPTKELKYRHVILPANNGLMDVKLQCVSCIYWNTQTRLCL